ncbi:MAG: phage tail protein [Clostridiales Family XIII bacterium]|jgi:phage tail-like protein|nr:phage tail protein [Clostridiales Family XIII bacterium]
MAFGATTPQNPAGGAGEYPYTKMNFAVSISGSPGEAAFSEITGLESTVDVIEFRQGNSGSLAPTKIPGLVKVGNLSMKFGITASTNFRRWIADCIHHQRVGSIRTQIIIELIDIRMSSPTVLAASGNAGEKAWVLENAWVTKYSGTDLNALQSEVAIETIEIAYEYMTSIPLPAAVSGGGGATA